MTINALLAQLKGVRKAGKGWMACCPAHDDHTPSLSLTEAADGKVLLHCFSGCSQADVVNAMGLTMSDLFKEGLNPAKRREYQRKAAKAAIQKAELDVQMAEKAELSAEDQAYLAKSLEQKSQAQALLARLSAEEAAGHGASLVLQRASDIQPEPIDWLWAEWLALGKLAILAGNPGSGKTTLALALAAVVTTGGTWPDGTACTKPGQVLIWSGEDAPSDTLVPRLMAAGADLDRVQFLSEILEDSAVRPFDPSQDIPRLAAKLEELKDVRLIIMDPIVSAVAGNAHQANVVRRSLQPIVDYAMKHGCAVIGITHFAKGSSERSPLERVIGSQAFGALARVVLVAAKEESEDGLRVLARAKSNIGPDGGGVTYSMEVTELEHGITTSRVNWAGTVEGSARAILAEIEGFQESANPSAKDQAEEWLSDLLSINGPLPAKEVRQKAQAAGISQKSLRSARESLNLVTKKSGFDLGWIWSLPDQAEAKMPSTNEGALHSGKGTFESLGHLRLVTPLSQSPLLHPTGRPLKLDEGSGNTE